MKATELQTAYMVPYTDGNEVNSMQALFEAAVKDHTKVISFYETRAKLCRVGSILSRGVAILAGGGAAVLLNPLIVVGIDAYTTASFTEADGVRMASILAIAAGVVLMLDFGFGFTRKYTNWNVVAFELAFERAKFMAAFRKLYLSQGADTSAAAFDEAKTLCDETFEDFRDKQVEETTTWAANTQSVMEALRKQNKTLQSTTQTASTAAAKKANDIAATKSLEKAAAAAAEKAAAAAAAAEKAAAGLTILVEETEDRKGKTLKVVVDSNGTPVWTQEFQAGESNGKFLRKGPYTVTLFVDGIDRASSAVTLTGDKTETI